MTGTADAPSVRLQQGPAATRGPDRVSGFLVTAVPFLQAVITVAGGVALVAALVLGPRGLALPAYALVLAIALAILLGAGVSTLWTWRRRSRGRVLALVIDYLLFVGTFILLLHLSGVFIGFDDLADVFGAGLPWLALGLLAFVLGYIVDAAAHRPAVHRSIGIARAALLIVALAGFLLAIDAPRGAVALVSGLADPVLLFLALISAILLSFIVALWGQAGRVRFGATLRDNEVLDGFLLISPNFLGFLVFFAGPLLFSLYVSLTDWDAFSEPIFRGLQNYLDIFALQFIVLEDTSVIVPPGLEQGFTEFARVGPLAIAAKENLFWISLRNIIVFAIIAIPMAVAPALLLASLLNQKVRGIRVFRAIYFIPSVAGVVGIAIIWKQLLDQTVGWLNYLITTGVGFVNSTFGLAIVDPKIGWLSDPATALFIIAVVFAWTTVGFNAVLFLAGLQGIPADLYEAATIDGANRWQRFRNITLPSVSATTFFVVATTSILALQLFTEVFVLTSPPGAPNNATLTPVIYLYNQGFQNFEFGFASAVAWVLFALIFAFTIVQYRRQRAEAIG